MMAPIPTINSAEWDECRLWEANNEDGGQDTSQRGMYQISEGRSRKK
jgi:hypothetical protein